MLFELRRYFLGEILQLKKLFDFHPFLIVVMAHSSQMLFEFGVELLSDFCLYFGEAELAIFKFAESFICELVVP